MAIALVLFLIFVLAKEVAHATFNYSGKSAFHCALRFFGWWLVLWLGIAAGVGSMLAASLWLLGGFAG